MVDMEASQLLDNQPLTEEQLKMYAFYCKGRERICDLDSGPSSSLSKLARHKRVELDDKKRSSARAWRSAGVVIYGIFFFLLALAILCMPITPSYQLPYLLLFTTPISVILLALTIYRAATTTKRDWDFPTTAMGWGFWLAMIFISINTIVVLVKNADFVPALTNMFNASLAGSIIGFGVLAIGAILAISSFLRSSKLENDVTATVSQKDELHLMVMLKIYDHMCSIVNNRPWPLSPIPLNTQNIEAMIQAEKRGTTDDDKMLLIADKLATHYVKNSKLVTLHLSKHKLVNVITANDMSLQAAMNLNASSSNSSAPTVTHRYPALLPPSSDSDVNPASLLGVTSTM